MGNLNRLENDEIFKYISFDGNDKLYDYHGTDLRDLLTLIDKCYIRYRDSLNIGFEPTFGLELEFENSDDLLIRNNLKNILKSWKMVDDFSLKDGAEIVSPVLRDNLQTWEELREVCDVVSKFANIGVNSAAHVHVGAHILGEDKDHWLNLVKLWAVYESIIYKFSFGEFLYPRINAEYYARPVSQILWEKYILLRKENSIKTIFARIKPVRKQSINFGHVVSGSEYIDSNTIEFRCPNGTLDPIIWQNNVNLFVKILLYSSSDDFNHDIIDKRYPFTADRSFNDYIAKIYLDDALEFSDLIFSNNLDKIYFLRQYLKSFGVNDKPHLMEKAKVFTKR